MRLAVIIPVYNHARYVAQAIESALRQTRRPDRVIVIDDGSTDDSLTVCQTFASRGVEVAGRENRGAHATLNQLVELASFDCELIAILNSDDYCALERLARCEPEFERDRSASVVVSGLRQVDEDDQPLASDHPRGRWLGAVWSRWGEEDLDLAEWMGQANFAVTTSNVMARREFFAAHPFKPYRFNHDYSFLSHAALRGALRVVGEPLLYYRVHSANTINTTPAPLIRELLKQWLELHRELAADLLADPALRQRFYRFLRGSAANVSALPVGVLQVLLAQLAAEKPPEALAALVAALDENHWPELRRFPNSEIVNSFDGSSRLTSDAGALSDRLNTLRTQRDQAKAQAHALRELARLRLRLLRSKWVALGRTLGLVRGLDSDQGNSPEEKLASLRAAVARSRWLRLGRLSSDDTPALR
jgi:hypothetical protein